MSQRPSVEFYTTHDGIKSVRYRSPDGRKFLPLIDGKTGDVVDLGREFGSKPLMVINEAVQRITRALSMPFSA